MKIATLVIIILLCLGMLVVPVFETVAFVNNLDFALYNEIAVVSVQVGVAFCALVALLIMKPEFGIAEKIFGLIMPPIAIWNAMCFVQSEWKFSIFFGLVWVGLILVIYGRFVPDSVVKAISAIVSVLLGISLVVLYIVYGIFQPVVNQRTVEETYTSPSGQYVAEMMINKSPLDETTVVAVRAAYPQKHAFLGQYEYKDIDLYEGESHEIHTAVISWKDDDTLVINGVEYEVKFGE